MGTIFEMCLDSRCNRTYWQERTVYFIGPIYKRDSNRQKTIPLGRRDLDA
jgi:hypothetical protein